MLSVLIVEKLSGVLEAVITLSGIASATTFGVFTLGMLVPRSNSYGAVFGALAGATISGWIAFGRQAAIAAKLLIPNRLNTTIEGCINETIHTNMTKIIQPIFQDQSDVFPLYRLSFHWINPIGVASVLIVGIIVSYLFESKELQEVDPDLISPIMHRLVIK